MYLIKIDQLEQAKKALKNSNNVLKKIKETKSVLKAIKKNNKAIEMLNEEFLKIRND